MYLFHSFIASAAIYSHDLLVKSVSCCVVVGRRCYGLRTIIKQKVAWGFPPAPVRGMRIRADLSFRLESTVPIFSEHGQFIQRFMGAVHPDEKQHMSIFISTLFLLFILLLMTDLMLLISNMVMCLWEDLLIFRSRRKKPDGLCFIFFNKIVINMTV